MFLGLQARNYPITRTSASDCLTASSRRAISPTIRVQHGHGLGRRSRVAGDDIGRDAHVDEHVRVPGRADILGRRHD